MKMAVFWVVAPCSLVEFYRRFRAAYCRVMMEAVSTSEKSVNFYQTTWGYNPKDIYLLVVIQFQNHYRPFYSPKC
jgi:hypothetical protein